MNGPKEPKPKAEKPKWRTYSGFKKIQEAAAEGVAWTVLARGEEATVRVPTLKKKLRDLTFSFRPDDSFLELLPRFRNDPNYKISTTRDLDPLSEKIVNGLTLESLSTQYKRWTAVQDQSAEVEITEGELKKLGVSVGVFLAAQEYAARAIAEHFLTRSATKKK